MSLTLYLLRHGQTPCSRENRFCGSVDPDITEDGVEMAEAFAQSYSAIEWEAIFSSPMSRTQATARPLSEAIDKTVHLHDGFKEINYGKWEGLTVEQVATQFHDDYIRWLADPAWYPPSGGEAAIAIANRAMNAIEEIQSKYSSGNVLIVSHKATIRIMLCSLLGIDVGRFRYRLACPVGSVSIVEFGTHGPLIKALADRIHLSDRLRNLPGT